MPLYASNNPLPPFRAATPSKLITAPLSQPTGAAGVLRLCALVHHPAHHTALVHLPSIPQRRDTCRDLEDHLQGALGVSCVSPNTDCDVLSRRTPHPAPDEDIKEKGNLMARRGETQK